MRTLADRVAKLEMDMYNGDGKDNPSITTRMALVEDNLNKLSSLMNKIVQAVIGLVCAVALQVVLRLLKLM